MNLPNVVDRYARRFAAVHRGEHSVSSPLGAWLVLATAAQAATGEARDELEEVLGLDVSTAASALDALLRDPPDVVRAALAAWGFTGADWVRRLPAAVETGPVPTQTQADAWAREHTLGLIDQFPVGDIAALDGLLASALATRVSWVRPFELTGADELHSPWSTQVAEVLEDGEADGFLADTEQAGTVAVHTAYAEGALQVTSVIAGIDVEPVDVLAAAHHIAVAEATGAPVSRHSLSDMALGDGAFWTITEEHTLGGGERVRAILPAWQAKSDHDLMANPTLGFGVAARALIAAADGWSAPAVDAVQCAVARYGQYGFEAAAITTIALTGAFLPSEPTRVATLCFGHPYAVVAVARGNRRGDPWAGMPVFAAWVREPSDASAVTTGS